jgi:transcriptional regulator with XRE-family HTH domain
LTGTRRASSTTRGAMVRRRRLGAELRRRREAAGLTIEQVADRLECSASKISRLETGHTRFSSRDVRDMLELYGVGEPDFEELMAVARDTREPGWWQSYGSVLSSDFVDFESEANLIRSYEAQCIPGLLQTEEYARSLLQASPNRSAAEVEDRVRVRMARQALLSREDPVQLWCVVDEAALLRHVGGRDKMRRQLEHLVAAANRPNVRLQVLTLRSGAHPGMDGSFVLLSYPNGAYPDTVYVAMATGGVFQEKHDELRRYESIFGRLRDVALPTAESATLVTRMAEEST